MGRSAAASLEVLCGAQRGTVDMAERVPSSTFLAPVRGARYAFDKEGQTCRSNQCRRQRAEVNPCQKHMSFDVAASLTIAKPKGEERCRPREMA